MNISSAIVKKTAIIALKNKYTGGVVSAAVYLFTWLIGIFIAELLGTAAGGAVSVLFIILYLLFLMLPLTMGFVYWSVRVIFIGDCEPLIIFKYFSSRSNYLRALKLWLPITGNALFSGFLLFLPGIFADMAASGEIFTLFGAQIPLWASSLWGVAAFLKFAATICLILVLLKFYLAPFLLAADEKMQPLEAIHMSKTIATRSRKDFIWFLFSFAGYFIACVFMIPTIFILPYFITSYAVHCRFVIAAYNKDIDRINQKNIPSFEADISF